MSVTETELEGMSTDTCVVRSLAFTHVRTHTHPFAYVLTEEAHIPPESLQELWVSPRFTSVTHSSRDETEAKHQVAIKCNSLEKEKFAVM